MATFAARRLATVADNISDIVAIELLAATQGLDFQRPLQSSAPVEAAHALIRRHVPHLDEDRPMAPDIAAIAALLRDGAFDGFVPLDLDAACK
jgi:histidine ammonia-lyase